MSKKYIKKLIYKNFKYKIVLLSKMQLIVCQIYCKIVNN